MSERNLLITFGLFTDNFKFYFHTIFCNKIGNYFITRTHNRILIVGTLIINNYT